MLTQGDWIVGCTVCEYRLYVLSAPKLNCTKLFSFISIMFDFKPYKLYEIMCIFDSFSAGQ